MRKLYLLSFILITTLLFGSCKESSEEGEYDNWRERNEAFIDSLESVYANKKDPELLRIQNFKDKASYIYFKKLKGEATSEESPYSTSIVRVNYRGMLIDEGVFGKMKEPKYLSQAYRELKVFDKTFNGDDPLEEPLGERGPVEFEANQVISGWTAVLQYMRPGERWEIYIPYESAYGERGKDAIPGFSALIFDLQLLSFRDSLPHEDKTPNSGF